MPYRNNWFLLSAYYVPDIIPVHMVSFGHKNCLMRSALLAFPFYRWGKRGTERFGNFPKISEPIEKETPGLTLFTTASRHPSSRKADSHVYLWPSASLCVSRTDTVLVLLPDLSLRTSGKSAAATISTRCLSVALRLRAGCTWNVVTLPL